MVGIKQQIKKHCRCDACMRKISIFNFFENKNNCFTKKSSKLTPSHSHHNRSNRNHDRNRNRNGDHDSDSDRDRLKYELKVQYVNDTNESKTCRFEENAQ